LAIPANSRAIHLLFQQGAYPDGVLWQHTEGPLGGGHDIIVHPVGQAVVVSEVVVVVVFVPIVLAAVADTVFFAANFGADDATVVSSAQAGTTKIRASKHISILFMVISQWLKKFPTCPT
jgi:hypothetical protein